MERNDKIKKALIYPILYIDRFIVALFPMLSNNRIDLHYLDHKNTKKSITRVVLLALIISMISCYYWAAFVGGFCALYVIYWTVKNKIKKSKIKRD